MLVVFVVAAVVLLAPVLGNISSLVEDSNYHSMCSTIAAAVRFVAEAVAGLAACSGSRD